MAVLASPTALREFAAAKRNEMGAYEQVIYVCGGTGCQASSCLAVIEALRQELASQGLEDKVKVTVTGCHGFCEQGPLMIINPGNILYCKLKAEAVAGIVTRTLRNGEIIEEYCYTDLATGQKVVHESEVPFYKAQDRTVLGMNKLIDCASIEEYISYGGYTALATALTRMAPQEIIGRVKEAGLRGRGGAGFPTGIKWEQARAVPAETRYVICNADEGDPGAYMDRSVLEGNPHRVIEGMAIGAFATGASQGIIYVRKEYPLAVVNARVAIEQAKSLGLLGENILGSGFSFGIRIVRGGGAFICGESSALMASVMGKVGEPRAKDVHAIERGLYDQPTVLNNVETWANVPLIIKHGAEWFASKGTGQSKGTKIFALTGAVKNTGLVEVEMGTPLKDIIFGIGGGAPDGKKIKAVQTGGPSGGCLPVEKFDLPVDFEALTAAGSMVGSGGMIVMDETTCMVDVARYFLRFLQDESCGKCSVCRLGIDRMLEIVEDITGGRGREEQIAVLEDIASAMSIGSLCALGKTAPNPVLSTLKYFRHEYDAHIQEHRCPAGVCRPLISFSIDSEKCTSCGVCARECPGRAISGSRQEPYRIDATLCSKCGICRDACRFGAVAVA